MSDPLLVVDDLHLAFGNVKAINGVTFDVRVNELLALIGPNGAGKSSIFNVVSGVYRPQQGSVRLRGEELVGQRPDRIAGRGVARTFQNIELFSRLTVLDNLMLGRHLHFGYGVLAAAVRIGRARRQETQQRRAAEDVIDLLELSPWRDAPVGLLPYGIQKRVELGRALCMEPTVLLLDEPVAGMNREETEDFARYLNAITEQLDLATIMVEHDMGLVMDLADRVVVVDFGTQIATGAPEDIQRNPAVLRAYLGDAGEEDMVAT